MKLLILLLLPFIGVSQVTKVSNLNMYYPFDFKYSGKTAQGDSTWDGRLSQPFVDSLRNAVATNNTQSAQITSLSSQGVSNTAAITTVTSDVKSLSTKVQGIETTVLNQGVQISTIQQQVNAADILVNSPTFTLTSDHNGRTIKISSKCVVTFPSGLNIKCSIIRASSGAVTLSGSYSSNLGYRNIAGVPGKIDIDYTNGVALITGNLTK